MNGRLWMNRGSLWQFSAGYGSHDEFHKTTLSSEHKIIKMYSILTHSYLCLERDLKVLKETDTHLFNRTQPLTSAQK